MDGSKEAAKRIMAQLGDSLTIDGQMRKVAKADVYARLAIAEALEKIAKQLQHANDMEG